VPVAGVAEPLEIVLVPVAAPGPQVGWVSIPISRPRRN
jgi:hypothetical protein